VRQSNGRAVAVEENRIRDWLRLAFAREGIAVCPEAAACVGALERLASEGWIQPDEEVVLFNTGAAQKYPEALEAALPRLDKNAPPDWEKLASS
jgi:threonine synthase